MAAEADEKARELSQGHAAVGGGELPESDGEGFCCFVFTLILPCSFS